MVTYSTLNPRAAEKDFSATIVYSRSGDISLIQAPETTKESFKGEDEADDDVSTEVAKLLEFAGR